MRRHVLAAAALCLLAGSALAADPSPTAPETITLPRAQAIVVELQRERDDAQNRLVDASGRLAEALAQVEVLTKQVSDLKAKAPSDPPAAKPASAGAQ